VQHFDCFEVNVISDGLQTSKSKNQGTSCRAGKPTAGKVGGEHCEKFDIFLKVCGPPSHLLLNLGIKNWNESFASVPRSTPALVGAKNEMALRWHSQRTIEKLSLSTMDSIWILADERTRRQ
jgi:hypothetical protein